VFAGAGRPTSITSLLSPPAPAFPVVRVSSSSSFVPCLVCRSFIRLPLSTSDARRCGQGRSAAPLISLDGAEHGASIQAGWGDSSLLLLSSKLPPRASTASDGASCWRAHREHVVVQAFLAASIQLLSRTVPVFST